MSGNDLGVARISLTVDTTEFETRIDAARNKTTGLGDSADAAFNKLTGGAKRAADSVLKYMRNLDATIEQQKLLNLAAKGGSDEFIKEINKALDERKQKIKEIAAAQAALNQQAEFDSAAKIAAENDKLREQARVVKALTAQFDALEAAEKKQASDTAFVDSLRRESAAIGKTRVDLLELKAAEMGLTSQAAPFIAQLRAQEQALLGVGRAAKQSGIEFNKYGLSAKQQLAAMRGVPAQITDIFISLQGGQNPLTVILQQGGQLKDMFGGIVPAARALSSGLMALVNPYTLAAAAAGVFLFTLGRGEARINSFNKALLFSGQAGALSAQGLQDSANALDQISGITSGEAAEALTLLASSGVVAADQYDAIVVAAERMESVAGKAMKDTIAEYVEIAKDPVNAILKFNEAENFLTLSVYERVRAMQEAGDIEGAAAIASEARAAAQTQRADTAIEELGLLSGAWHAVKESTGEAWDESVGYFAQLDLDAKSAIGSIKQLAQQYGSIHGIRAMAFGNVVPGSIPDAAPANKGEPTIDSKAAAALQRIREGNYTAEKRQALEIQQIKINAAKIGLSELETAELIRESQAKYAASLAKGSKAKGDGGLANAEASAGLQAIKDQLAQEQAALQNSRTILTAEYSAKLLTVEDYYAKQRELISKGTAAEESALTQQIALLRDRSVAGKDSVNVSKQIGELEAQLAKVRMEGATSLKVLGIQETAVMQAREQASKAYTQNLANQLVAQRASIDATLLGITLGAKAASQQIALNKIKADGILEEQRLLDQRTAAGVDGESAYQKALADHRAYMAALEQQTIDGFAAIDDAQANWLNGLSTGIRDWADAARDVASQIEAITTNTLNNAADTMANAALTGKLAWRDFLIDLGEQITKFLAKQAVLNFLEAFAGSQTGQKAASSGGIWGQIFTAVLGAFTKNAKGDTYKSPSLSAYSGSVVSSPTPFMFAKGAGIMGEAGAEAILPLKRGADGKLGVQAGGTGSSPQVNIAITTNVETGETTTTTSGDAAAYGEFAQKMRAVAEETVQRAIRPGGSLWKVGVGA